MNKWHPLSARSGIINLLVVLSLLAGLFVAGLDGVSAAQAAGAAPAVLQEATETPLPTDTPEVTATDTTEPTPTETATEEPTLESTAEPTAEPTVEPSATATVNETTPAPTATQSPEPQIRALAELIIPAGADIVPNAYIVVYKPGINVALAVMNDRAKIKAFGGRVTFVYTAALQGYAAVLSEAALEEARADPLVDYVVADQVLTIIDDPAESVNTIQSNPTWGLDRIDNRNLPLNNKYRYEVTGPDVHVYILDTGIRPSHNLKLHFPKHFW